MKILALVFATILLSGCGAGKPEKTKGSPFVIPPSEANASETADLAATLAEIEAITLKLGRPQRFNTVPIIVTSEDSKKSHRIGYCRFNRRHRFIAVNRKAFERQADFSSEIPNRRLFRVLLHEIGHCYYNRDHDNTLLSKPGLNIGVELESTSTSKKFAIYQGLCASIMCDKSQKLGGTPFELREYYVAEMLGIKRATDLAALEKHMKLYYVPRPESLARER